MRVLTSIIGNCSSVCLRPRVLVLGVIIGNKYCLALKTNRQSWLRMAQCCCGLSNPKKGSLEMRRERSQRFIFTGLLIFDCCNGFRHILLASSSLCSLVVIRTITSKPLGRQHTSNKNATWIQSRPWYNSVTLRRHWKSANSLFLDCQTAIIPDCLILWLLSSLN
jgi:hypothetical protein